MGAETDPNYSPIHTLASVPFQWEEKPGKPRPCSATFHKSKCLEPPPRLYSPSPTNVLDGPYNKIFSSSSFSFLRNCKETEKGNTFVLGKKKLINKGNWWMKRDVKLKGGRKSCVFSSSFVDSTEYGAGIDKGRSCSARMASFRSTESLSIISSKSHLWISKCFLQPGVYWKQPIYLIK